MTYQKNTILNPQICKVEIVPVEDVQVINIGITRMYRNVILKTGKSWQLIYSTIGKIEFSEEQQDDPAGPFFNQKLDFPYPGEDSSTRATINNMENQRFLVALTYNSGIRKLVGDIENPCLCKTIFSNEKGGHAFTFQRRSSAPAFLI